jgi:hypothetical protein
LVAAAVTGIIAVATWAAILWFLSSHNVDRQKKPPGVDWKDGPKFSHLFVIYTFFGFSWAIFQGYITWLFSTFSNEPSKLSYFSGFVEGMRQLGFVIAFAVDSRSTPFLTEVTAYFPLTLVGLILCAFSASRYTLDSTYGIEEKVVVPEAFGVVDFVSVGSNDRVPSVCKEAISKTDGLD